MPLACPVRKNWLSILNILYCHVCTRKTETICMSEYIALFVVCSFKSPCIVLHFFTFFYTTSTDSPQRSETSTDKVLSSHHTSSSVALAFATDISLSRKTDSSFLDYVACLSLQRWKKQQRSKKTMRGSAISLSLCLIYPYWSLAKKGEKSKRAGLWWRGESCYDVTPVLFGLVVSRHSSKGYGWQPPSIRGWFDVLTLSEKPWLPKKKKNSLMSQITPLF